MSDDLGDRSRARHLIRLLNESVVEHVQMRVGEARQHEAAAKVGLSFGFEGRSLSVIPQESYLAVLDSDRADDAALGVHRSDDPVVINLVIFHIGYPS